mgnify:CR=1 FL=1
MNLNEITYDPSRGQILGVFADDIHVKTYTMEGDPVVLILSTKLFHKTWDNWLSGKRDYCESYKHYCGQYGYTVIEKGEILDRKINLNITNNSVKKPLINLLKNNCSGSIIMKVIPLQQL